MFEIEAGVVDGGNRGGTDVGKRDVASWMPGYGRYGFREWGHYGCQECKGIDERWVV